MRRKSFVLGFSTLAASCGRSGARTDGSATRGKGAGIALLVLGDSLAFGTGASTPEGGFAWRTYLELARSRPGSEITNVAIGGATAHDVLRLEVPRLAQLPTPDVAILCVGANDVTRLGGDGNFLDDYAECVRLLRSRAPHALLVLCGVPDVALSPLFANLDRAQLESRTHALDDTVRLIARDVGATFFDLYAFTRAQRTNAAAFLASDQFHPSDDGHERIANALVPLIERRLASDFAHRGKAGG